jgi:hypothetical protein
MITYHRRAATNRLNRDCLSSSPSVCNVFINAQCHLYSVNSRRAPHAEAERERERPGRDGHTRTHAHVYIFTLFSDLFPHTPCPNATPAQHQTGPRVSGDSSLHPGVWSPTPFSWSLSRDPHTGPGARACAHTRNNDIGDAMQIAAHVHVHCAMTMCMCIVMCTKLYYHVYWCPLRLEEQRPRVTTSKEFTGAAGA